MSNANGIKCKKCKTWKNNKEHISQENFQVKIKEKNTMDPFTQRMLEKAEQRSRALGITNAGSKFPLAESGAGGAEYIENGAGGDASNAIMSPPLKEKPQKNQTNLVQAQPTTMPNSPHSMGSATGKSSGKSVLLERTKLDASPGRPLHHYAAVNKENMDLGIEINITTDKAIGVQFEIQEEDMTTDSESVDEAPAQTHYIASNNPPLRDSSRNRLQRLGKLYSNSVDLSSPIHRTEEQFHAGNDNEKQSNSSANQKPKQRLCKLAALADTINQWEDDTSHHEIHQRTIVNAVAPPKPELPSRGRSAASKKPMAPQPPTIGPDSTDAVFNKTKQLKWDPQVISSLEAQGFQRRESSTVKHTYDYARETNQNTQVESDVQKQSSPVTPIKPAVSQVAKTFSKSDEASKPSEKIFSTPSVKSGLVSGRTAIFEQKATTNQNQTKQKPQKDPCELSLRERMKLFESGSSKAILPKAPITSAPTLSQMRMDHGVVAGREDIKVNAAASSSSTAAPLVVKPKTDGKLRDKVAALVANVQSSAESRIKDIDRQRQEDMQIISHRFTRQKELLEQQEQTSSSSGERTSAAVDALQQPKSNVVHRPMPPPPPPPAPSATDPLLSSKRRSPGDENDETKRARKSNPSTATTTTNRLYPKLSDLESSDDNGCASETASLSDATQQDEPESSMDDECIDELEAVEDDSSTDMCNVSLGREILQVVKDNDKQQQQQQQKAKKTVHYDNQDYYYDNDCVGHDSSLNSSSVASMGIDDYLDEALEEEEEEEGDYAADDDNDVGNNISRNSKGTTASNSFSFRRTSSEQQYVASSLTPPTILEDHEMNEILQTPVLSSSQPVKSELSVNQDQDNLVTLVHTVSFYRRQQNANCTNSTPLRKITREHQMLRSALDAGGAKHKLEYDSPQQSGGTSAIPESECDDPLEQNDEDAEMENGNDNDAMLVQNKIKKLLDEVCKQQQVIGQASQALNLCAATIEFSGSTESVEGERYLLLATHRRQACLDEVQRLRVENCLRPKEGSKERGVLTVQDITIPLRQEYVRKMASNTITGHHLVCLLKYNEHVLATKTIPTLPGLLSVKFPDVLQLNNVYADFKITLEIYGMLAQRDQLPHELKYHINLNKKSGIKTPKKKGTDNILVMPPVQSPAGPQAVRTPQLVQYGFAIFSLREIQRTNWTLTQVLGVSPLEGVLHMKINCALSVSVQYKGFLTMFEDISGFGAWHRRWCHLNGTVINYWKYPDDEKKKAPMGSIELKACVSPKISTAPRDICARLHTILLECERPAKPTDKESLIIVPNGNTTLVRYLLSADTKEEKDDWLIFFRKALLHLRIWGEQNKKY